MCIHDATSRDCDVCLPSTNLHPILYGVVDSEERIDYDYIAGHANFMSANTALSSPPAQRPVCRTPDQPVQTTENSMNIQQPPDHVMDYWFDWPGLSLDLPSLGNSSSLTNFSSQFPFFDRIDGSVSGNVTAETRSLGDPLVSNCESQERSVAPVPVPLLSPLNHDQHPRAQPHGVARHQPRIVRARLRVYDQPGKKPAAEYQPDAIKLQATCRRRGGADFACQWILTVFKDGVTLEALVRRLKLTEIERMDFPGGFGPCRAYDGFLEKGDDSFECCLCAVGKRVWWKNKKDAVRHLRKFHFGLADRCITCYSRIYSTGEMKSHRCTQRLLPPATAMGPDAGADTPLDSIPN